MNKRSRLAALLGAGVLMLAMVGAASAAASPVLGITKGVDHSTLSGPGTVTYTIVVTATTGTFHQVVVTDANCDSNTLAWTSGTGQSTVGPSGNGSAGFLHETDSWTYTCTRALSAPGTYHNTASADGCTDGSVQGCNQGSHASSGSSNDATTTVTAGGNSSPGASGQPSTDTLVPTGESGPANAAWLIIAALGVLLGSLVVLSPARIGRRR